MAQAQSQYIIEIQLVDGQAQAKLNGVSVSLKDVDQQLKNIKSTSSGASSAIGNVGKAAKGTTKANQDLISSSGLAGATLVETGRLISDLPFGITAVTNNLSQLSTLFITLASKTEESGGAFKALGKQLAGPLGFILAFQVVIALLQAYQKEILGFIKGTDDANEATKEFSKSIDDLSKKLKENNKDFKDANDVESKLITIREQLRLQSEGTRQERARAGKNILGQVEALKKLGKEIDITRLKEEGYIDTLIKENKSSKDISQQLEDRRIQIEEDRIRRTASPLELAQRELDLFIDTQKELNVLESAYLKSEEYRTLVAKRDALIPREQTELLESFLTPEGVTLFGQAQIDSELLLTQALRDQAAIRKELRRLEGEDILELANMAIANLDEISNNAFEAEISREERKTALLNNELSMRLRNENLSEKERESINAQIEANELKLQIERDKIAEKQFKMQKALNIASALAETFRTGVLAYGSQLIIGDPTSPLRAQIAQGIAIASGLANVAMIARQQFVPSAIGASGGAGGAGGAGAGAGIQAPDFNIVGASGTSQLAQTVAGQQAKPIRAFVVGKDISTQQELDRNITNTASLG